MARPLPETVLFDLDGTLVDNFEAIHRCYDDVMGMMGLPGVTLEQIRRAVGDRIARQAMGRAALDTIERLAPQEGASAALVERLNGREPPTPHSARGPPPRQQAVHRHRHRLQPPSR